LDFEEEEISTFFRLMDKGDSGFLSYKELVKYLHTVRTKEVRLQLMTMRLEIPREFRNIRDTLNTIMQASGAEVAVGYASESESCVPFWAQCFS